MPPLQGSGQQHSPVLGVPFYLYVHPLTQFLEFCNGVNVKKTRFMPLPYDGKTDDMLQYRNVTDRQMDGFATTVSCCACIGTWMRDKNRV